MDKHWLFLKGLLAGALVGGVMAWLLAPQSGLRTRAMALGWYRNMTTQVGDAAESTRNTLREDVAKTRLTLDFLRSGGRRRTGRS